MKKIVIIASIIVGFLLILTIASTFLKARKKTIKEVEKVGKTIDSIKAKNDSLKSRIKELEENQGNIIVNDIVDTVYLEVKSTDHFKLQTREAIRRLKGFESR